MRRQELEMRQRRDVSLTRTMRTPHPFPNLSTSGESGIVAASTRNRSVGWRLPTGRLSCTHTNVWSWILVCNTAS
ncbi:hypothetical protein Plhal703r1_c55g0160331 [Plasmopara halstedii]